MEYQKIITNRTRKRVLDDDKEIEIIKLYESGLSTRKIAIMFGVGKSSISPVLNAYGIKAKTTGNAYCLRKYSFDQFFFENIDDEYKAYWLGFLGADGHLMENEGVQLGLCTKDKAHIELFLTHIKSTHPIKDKEDKRGCFLSTVSLYSKITAQNLYDLGFRKDKSKTHIYPEIKEEYHRHHIRGLFDGDGCVFAQYRRNGMQPSVGFSGTLETVTEIANILNKYLGTNIPKIQIGNNNFAVVSYGGGKQCVKILDWMYKDCNVKLERKYNIYLNILEYRKKYE